MSSIIWFHVILYSRTSFFGWNTPALYCENFEKRCCASKNRYAKTPGKM